MKSLRGQLLIAAPELLDPNFVKSVVLMIQHDEDGALGLILNRPTQLTVRAAWEQVSKLPCAAEGVIHQGGPVGEGLMVVHAREKAAEVQVCQGVYFSHEPEKVEWLLAQGATPSKFVVGYAGWLPGQLETELETDSWVVGPASASIVFSTDQRLWELLMTIRRWAAVGVDSLRLDLIPGDASMN